MDIAVNARFLMPGRLEGIGTFTWEVISRLARQHPEHTFHLFFDRRFSPQFLTTGNLVPHVVPPQARHPLLFIAWFEYTLRSHLEHLNPAVVFSPDGYLSLNLSRRIPQVPVFHDLAFRHFPAAISRAEKWHYERYFPRYAQRAARIMTVSEFSKTDIQHQFNVPADTIDVVYNGARGTFSPMDSGAISATRQNLTGGAPYFLYLGAIQPRKNLPRLLQAFDRFKAETQSSTRLVITGRKAWKTAEIEPVLHRMDHSEAVIFTGYVPEEELAPIVGSARALAYVSLFEGFGLPILEAMHAEVPVLTSTVTSMPEVAGDAALTADPTDIYAIAEGLQRLDAEPQLRERLIEAGKRRRGEFSWDRTAHRVWNSLSLAMAPSTHKIPRS
jgi:glycosyltransferase involved in cell wall biosynthesis